MTTSKPTVSSAAPSRGRVYRMSVSLDPELAAAFDRQIAEDSYPTRSAGVAELIRRYLADRAWVSGPEVAGAVVLLYNPHRRDVVRQLNDAQHDHHDQILAVQHFHLDHERCLEILAVRGHPKHIQELVRRMRSLKGVDAITLAVAAPEAATR